MAFEFRGLRNLVVAELLVDTEEQLIYGPVKRLSYIAQVTRETATNSATSYYDDNPMIVKTSVGADTLNFTITPPDLDVLAEVTGQDFIYQLGAMVEGARTNNYFAVGYEYSGTDGRTRYVWRYKGQFQTPSEDVKTADDSVDSSNTTITYTSINTTHKFLRTGKTAKDMIIDDTYDRVNIDTFFDEVHTPDNTEGRGSGVPEPEFIPQSGVFNTSIKVTISTPTTASIRYTTDGSKPTADNGQDYTEPITVSDTTTIQAYAYTGGGAVPSRVVSKTYIKM